MKRMYSGTKGDDGTYFELMIHGTQRTLRLNQGSTFSLPLGSHGLHRLADHTNDIHRIWYFTNRGIFLTMYDIDPSAHDPDHDKRGWFDAVRNPRMDPERYQLRMVSDAALYDPDTRIHVQRLTWGYDRARHVLEAGFDLSGNDQRSLELIVRDGQRRRLIG